MRRLTRFSKPRLILNRFACLLAWCIVCGTTISIAVPARASNLFNDLETGGRSNFTGTVGFAFTANSNFTIFDLGRAVNPAAALTQSHLVQLWDNTTQTDIGDVTVGPASPLDALGYAYAPLPSAINLVSGHSYSLSTQETGGGPDLWGDQRDLNGKYNSSLITVDNAAFNPGNPGGGFPVLAGLPGAGFGVPTFFTAAVPEPSSFILCGIGAAALFIAFGRRRKV